ncbi:hypothetical protein MSAS_28810 [Mycobacterium saskatchewanense]|nr:hypothetical protein MSAS_28810 [Mycobacterium saskatchewanense]
MAAGSHAKPAASLQLSGARLAGPQGPNARLAGRSAKRLAEDQARRGHTGARGDEDMLDVGDRVH